MLCDCKARDDPAKNVTIHGGIMNFKCVGHSSKSSFSPQSRHLGFCRVDGGRETMPHTWFITGVNSGFGRKMTEQLLARGDRVAGTARRLNEVDDLKSSFGDQFWLASLDVTDTAAVRKVVDQAFADLGRIDVIVSNAGYGLSGAVEELSYDQIDHQLATNVRGCIPLGKGAPPHLRAQSGGRILQLSSMGGQIALPGLSLYHAPKWAMEGFFEATAQDVASFNIQTTLVEPA